MAAARTLARLGTLAWTLIYAGLLTLVLGIASHGHTVIGGWSLSVLGVVAVVAGVVVLVVCARMGPEDPPPP
jgi:uncharacterized membrane protein HdeD (DUF308 family)